MGKYTKQVYFCDECKKEFEDDVLELCSYCEKDICADCATEASILYSENGETIKKVTLMACKEHMKTDKVLNDLVKRLTGFKDDEPQNIRFSD